MNQRSLSVQRTSPSQGAPEGEAGGEEGIGLTLKPALSLRCPEGAPMLWEVRPIRHTVFSLPRKTI